VVAKVHANGTGALMFEVTRRDARVYAKEHLRRLQKDDDQLVGVIDFFAKLTENEYGREAGEAFRERVLYIYRSIELSEQLPSPQVELERRSLDETLEALARAGKKDIG